MNKVEPINIQTNSSTYNIGFENIATNDDPPIQPPSEKIAGYENIGFDIEAISKPPEYVPEIKSNLPRNNFQTVPILTEDEAREVLSAYVDTQCCYGKKPVEKMVFTDIQSSNSYRYLLQTFFETRTTQWVFESYHGQILMNNGSQPPLPWDIVVQPKEIFREEIVLLEIPNTANVKPCQKCNMSGMVRCSSCGGIGRKRCFSCFGSGYTTYHDHHHHSHRRSCMSCMGRGYNTCMTCMGRGIHTCPNCKGTGKLKWFIQLTVKYQVKENDFIKKSENVPDEKLKNCQAVETFTEQNQRVTAVNHHHDVDINKASVDILQQHLQSLQATRIIMQLHKVFAIPVTLCKYKFNDKDYDYIIYGLDKKVHLTKYAYSCCWCCSIL